MGADLTITIADGVALLTLNRPDDLNALNSELTRALESMPAAAPTPMGVGTTGNTAFVTVAWPMSLP